MGATEGDFPPFMAAGVSVPLDAVFCASVLFSALFLLTDQNRGARHAGGSRNRFQGGRAEAARKPKQRKREGQPGLCRARVPCRHVLALCVTDLAYLVRRGFGAVANLLWL